MAEPILKLDLLVEHHTVEINGVAFELKNLDELTVLQTLRFEKRAKSIAALMTNEPADDEAEERQARELEAALNYLVRMVLPLPEDLFARLDVNKKLAIAMAFSSLLQAMAPPAGGIAPTAPSETTSTGENSSPA